jgi:predicted transport protein
VVLFKVLNGKAKQINFSKLKSEKELQGLVERNLEEIFGLKFIESEFTVHPFRLDTIAFDDENKAMVIIEYKQSEDYSIIDQGISYLNLLLNHKGDFQLALERRLNKRIDVDWSQSRILFIAKSFNAYQLGALSQTMPFELWKYIPYEDEIIGFEPLKPQFAQTIGFPSTKIAQAVQKEIKVYTLEDRLRGKNENIKQIFSNLREAILNLNPEIKEKVTKHYIAYELTRNFTEFVIQASAVKVYLDIPIRELQDAAHISQDCSNIGHWATGDTRFKVRSPDEVAYAIGLIKQSYEKSLH